jgi:YaiO family outer membrane protein
MKFQFYHTVLNRVNLVLIIVLYSGFVFGQDEIKKDSASLDILFSKARSYAFNDQKVKAREMCRYILTKDFTYYDAAVLLGRTYAWDKMYDSAKTILQSVIKKRPGYYDAIDALIDIDLWTDQYTSAINNADIGLSFHPNDEAFLLKKAKALNYTGNIKGAIELLNQVLTINPSNAEASKLLFSIKENKKINKVSISYSVDAFDIQNPWNYANISFSRRTKTFGTMVARLNYANRFEKTGYQFEIDAYPTISKKSYLYFNTGYSSTSLFPIFRLTLEPYFNLGKGNEASIGIRYMNFDSTRLVTFDSNKVIIYTCTYGKYFGNYWISLRPYFTNGKMGLSKSVNITIRRYFKTADNYISLILGMGFTPDEHQNGYTSPELYNLKSDKIGLNYQQKFAKYFLVNLGAAFADEEYYPGLFRQRYSFDTGLSYIF